MTTKAVILGIFGALASGTIHQLGDTQPFDLVMVHKNPTATDLGNGFADTVANHTVVILDDGVARPDLTLNIDLKNKHTVVLLSTAAQSIKIQVADLPEKTIELVADVPQILTIDVVLGAGELVLPVMETKSFFDLAVDDEEQPSTAFWSKLINTDYIDGQLVYNHQTVVVPQAQEPQAAMFAQTQALQVGDIYRFKADMPFLDTGESEFWMNLSFSLADVDSKFLETFDMLEFNKVIEFGTVIPKITIVDIAMQSQQDFEFNHERYDFIEIEVIATGLKFTSFDAQNQIKATYELHVGIESKNMIVMTTMPLNDPSHDFSFEISKIA